MVKDRGLTLLDLEKRSQYSSDSTTSGQCFNEQENPAVGTPVSDADDQLGEMSSSIPPVDPEVLTLKHSNFLSHLLIEKVDLAEFTHGGSHYHAVFLMPATDGPQIGFWG